MQVFKCEIEYFVLTKPDTLSKMLYLEKACIFFLFLNQTCVTIVHLNERVGSVVDLRMTILKLLLLTAKLYGQSEKHLKNYYLLNMATVKNH